MSSTNTVGPTCLPDIMCIAESISIKDIDVAWCHESILNRTGHHMPRIEKHQAGQYIQCVGASHRHHDIAEGSIVKHFMARDCGSYAVVR